MTDSTLCYHCHKPLVDGACPDPIVVKSIKRLRVENQMEIRMRQAEARQEAAEVDHAWLLERYNRANAYAAELEAELEVERTAEKLQRDKAIASHAKVDELREQNGKLAREAIGMKVAWEEVRRENERLRTERDVYVDAAQRKIEDLREALKQILEDPDALIRDSHRDDGWEAIGDY